MISLLKGTIELSDGQYLIVYLNGIGYKVFVPQSVLSKNKPGDEIKLYIHSHVREEAFDLYGFTDFSDLKLFENLLNVSGVGPKTALAVFSVGTREMIVKAIMEGNVTFFTGVSRLGKKNAQKIIIELKTKLGSIRDLDLLNTTFTENNEVIAALKNFGFNDREIVNALKEVNLKNKTTEEETVRLALKQLGK